MSERGDVVILGGGVIGLTTAYFLAREGCRVVVADRTNPAGQEASWAGAGILPPSDPVLARHPLDRLRALGNRIFPTLSDELRESTGIDNEYQRCGGIARADTLAEADAHEWHGEGVEPLPLTAEALARLEPALCPRQGPFVLLPDLAQLRNPRHVRALAAGCRASGRVTLLEGVEVVESVVDGSRIKELRARQGTNALTLEGGSFLVAAGAWTDNWLTPLLGRPLGVAPVRGQIVLLNAGPTPPFRHVLIAGPRYLVPRRDGRVLVGSTEEHVGFAKRTTSGAIASLLAFAASMVPALTHAAVEQCWAGLRPGNPDGLPFLGRVPGFENLFVGAGHYRSGIQLSPGSALLLQEMILGRPPSLPVEPFGLERRIP